MNWGLNQKQQIIQLSVKRVSPRPQQASLLHAGLSAPYISLYVGTNKAFAFLESLTCHTENTEAQQQKGPNGLQFPALVPI